MDDGLGEVVVGLAEGITSFDPPRRYRKGCWWLTAIVVVVAVIAVIVMVDWQ